MGVHMTGNAYLGTMDTAFLFAYAFGTYFSGHLAERSDQRVFLSCGMLGSALMSALYGYAFFTYIHQFWFFFLIMFTAGLYQSTGWPSVIHIMGQFFQKGKLVHRRTFDLYRLHMLTPPQGEGW